MHRAAKLTKKLDNTPHENEEAILALVKSADGEAGSVVAEAREVGISWPAIIALMIEYGPQFVAMLQAIIQALKTPVPEPRQETPEECAA